MLFNGHSMPFHLRNSRKPSHFSTSIHIFKFLAPNGGFFFVGGAGVHSPSYRQVALRGRGVQGKQIGSSSVPLYFLPNSFTYSSVHCTHHQIPSILPHPSPLSPLPKSLPLNSVLCLKSATSLYCLDGFRHFSTDESYGGTESVVDLKEVERVCKVLDETFAIDRNMEAVLDECGIHLNHELVLGVLQRFKHARKPAFRFFCWASEKADYAHDSRTYNAMMDILGKSRQFETMISVLEEMGEKGLVSMETFIICIKAFAAAKERRKAIGVFDLMKKYRFKIGVETFNCLLDALGRAKLVKEAQALFDKMLDKFAPNIKTYTILLNGWCGVRDLNKAGRIWNEMIDSGFQPDIVAHNIMLEGLLKGGKRSHAIKLFEVMKSRGPLPNARSYTILINDHSKNGNTVEAMDYFDDMLNSGCKPDVAVYTCLMIGFGNKKKMDAVYQLLEEMKEKGCPPDGKTYNALIKMMVNQKMPDDAVKVYNKMIQSCIEPSIHSYNMIMKSYFVARNYEMGCAVWEEMKRKGCCPDENSYRVLIGGLIRQGRSNEACKYLEEMMDKGMKAPQLDLKKFSAGFSQAGRHNILEDFAQKMKFSGNSEVADLFARWLR